MRETFRGHVPDGLFYDTQHNMWVRREGDEVVIGATDFGMFLCGEVVAFTAKPRGAIIDRGRGFGTVESAKTVLSVRAPVAFTLTQGNEAAEEAPDLVNRMPYTAGWMARGIPRDWQRDLADLVDAAEYREHVLRIEPDARLE